MHLTWKLQRKSRSVQRQHCSNNLLYSSVFPHRNQDQHIQHHISPCIHQVTSNCPHPCQPGYPRNSPLRQQPSIIRSSHNQSNQSPHQLPLPPLLYITYPTLPSPTFRTQRLLTGRLNANASPPREQETGGPHQYAYR
ncbi:hypothetical protein V8C43DRAFT_117670 [Trichoderma afarasin]